MISHITIHSLKNATNETLFVGMFKVRVTLLLNHRLRAYGAREIPLIYSAITAGQLETIPFADQTV